MKKTEGCRSKLAFFFAKRCPDAARRSPIDDAVLPSKPKVSNALRGVSHRRGYTTSPASS